MKRVLASLLFVNILASNAFSADARLDERPAETDLFTVKNTAIALVCGGITFVLTTVGQHVAKRFCWNVPGILQGWGFPVTLGGASFLASWIYHYNKRTEYVVIPRNVRILPSFARDLRVRTVEFEEGSRVTEIPFGCFEGCSSLTSITLPDGIIRIPKSCFESCSSLTRVTTLGGIEEIGSCAFYLCEALTSIRLRQVKTIAERAFHFCFSLKEVYIDGQDCRIETHAFANTILNRAIFAGVQTIDAGAFFSSKAYIDLTECSLDIGNNVSAFLSGIFRGYNNVFIAHSSIGSVVVLSEGTYRLTGIVGGDGVWEEVAADEARRLFHRLRHKN
ncbi:MAG: leucine-rich repeat domain-containing protein [Holosporales bacterium]|jgi:hypothetical protein|nr:leucine-rich repeat domain-containing protein [Holosporales bacterium]